MKRIFYLLVAMLLPMMAMAERIEKVPYGDMESWAVRYIKESKLLGGKTKTMYCVAKKDTITKNAPYKYYGTYASPWATSNAYANVSGIEKAGGPTVYPEAREGGGYCARLSIEMLNVKVLGMINMEVLAAGSMFTGQLIEPVRTTKDPYKTMNIGIPFTKRPTALMLDYKCSISPDNWILKSDGLSKQRKMEGCHDEAGVQIFLQHRWEDADGRIHAKRVGTGAERFSTTQTAWQNKHRIPIHYGDISKESWFNSAMKLNTVQCARNSKGKMVLVEEEGWDATLAPTHMVIFMSSGKYEAFIGHTGNTLWVDNICLVYDK